MLKCGIDVGFGRKGKQIFRNSLCGMNVGLVCRHRCPIDHVNGCEIFTRLHHFDIFLGFCCCWSRGIDMYVCTCQQPVDLCVCLVCNVMYR